MTTTTVVHRMASSGGASFESAELTALIGVVFEIAVPIPEQARIAAHRRAVVGDRRLSSPKNIVDVSRHKY